MQINPRNLRSLRDRSGLTLEQLAESARVDRQTIHRLEKGIGGKPRASTIAKIAKALNVGIDELCGADIAIGEGARQRETSPKSQLNIRLADDVRNALNLVGMRYNVKPTHIVELAPYLFLWAAEKSLNERLANVERNQADEAAYEASFPEHLRLVCVTRGEVDEARYRERKSIAARDLVGTICDDYEDWGGSDEWTASPEGNPFALFLRRLIGPIPEDTIFDEWHPKQGPYFRLGISCALDLVGGDEDAAEHIVSGRAPLHEMPDHIRQAEPATIAAWAIETGEKKAEATLEALLASFRRDASGKEI